MGFTHWLSECGRPEALAPLLCGCQNLHTLCGRIIPRLTRSRIHIHTYTHLCTHTNIQDALPLASTDTPPESAAKKMLICSKKVSALTQSHRGNWLPRNCFWFLFFSPPWLSASHSIFTPRDLRINFTPNFSCYFLAWLTAYIYMNTHRIQSSNTCTHMLLINPPHTILQKMDWRVT